MSVPIAVVYWLQIVQGGVRARAKVSLLMTLLSSPSAN